MQRSVLTAVALILIAPLLALGGLDAADPAAGAAAAAPPRYQATVVRTRHGIPHVTAKN